jgi:GNAT superfamily N-acetyltransferase
MNFTWELKIATEKGVQPTIEQLTDHMNDQQRQAFRDAVRGLQVLGLVCVIDQAQFPPRFPEQKASHLQNFACGTQLLVHPSFRRQGVGGSLLTRAEDWAQERGLTGFWIVTHRKAEWYRTHFGYQELHRLDDKGVEKILLAKTFE